MDTIVLGQGVLGWPADERHSDRYGLIHLNAIPDSAHFTPLQFDTALVGTHGHLVAVVLETRPSPHIGDFGRAVGPSTPTVGDEIALGTGTLCVVPWRWGFSLVGVKPDEDRSHDWMDPAALYRCHHQTIRLELRHDTASANNGRCYGSSYSETAGLDLPELAKRLMADLVAHAADPDSGLPAHARYSAAVNPLRRAPSCSPYSASTTRRSTTTPTPQPGA